MYVSYSLSTATERVPLSLPLYRGYSCLLDRLRTSPKFSAQSWGFNPGLSGSTAGLFSLLFEAFSHLQMRKLRAAPGCCQPREHHDSSYAIWSWAGPTWPKGPGGHVAPPPTKSPGSSLLVSVIPQMGVFPLTTPGGNSFRCPKCACEAHDRALGTAGMASRGDNLLTLPNQHLSSALCGSEGFSVGFRPKWEESSGHLKM